MPRNSGKWTEGRYNGFVSTALRKAFGRWPPKYETLKEARTSIKINPATGRKAQHFKCKICKGEFTQKQVQVDHVAPVVGRGNFKDWNTFIERLFCEKHNLQVLCIPCHKIKTKKDNSENKLIND